MEDRKFFSKFFNRILYFTFHEKVYDKVWRCKNLYSKILYLNIFMETSMLKKLGILILITSFLAVANVFAQEEENDTTEPKEEMTEEKKDVKDAKEAKEVKPAKTEKADKKAKGKAKGKSKAKAKGKAKGKSKAKAKGKGKKAEPTTEETGDDEETK